MTRLQRQSRIKDLLSQTQAVTQEEIAHELEKTGIKVTQATISRDLASIGAVRGAHGYALPGAGGFGGAGDLGSLLGVVRDHVIRVVPAASIVVMHTAPGHANFVASEVDAARPSGMVGCLAGDDTIFIATPSDQSAKELAAVLGKGLEVD